MARSHARGHEQKEPDQAPAPRPATTSAPADLLHLQRAAGNAAVSRHVQRYAVGVKDTADHKTLMDWLTTKNPYAPDSAAKTRTKFTYKVAWVTKGEPGSWTVTPSDAAAVVLEKSVDMPVWAAKDPKLQAAWSGGVTALRAHEKAHEDLADTWRTTLQGRLASFSATSTGANETEAGKDASKQLATEWATWVAEAQTAQEGLDPYSVVVTDPYPRAAPTPAPPADGEAESESE